MGGAEASGCGQLFGIQKYNRCNSQVFDVFILFFTFQVSHCERFGYGYMVSQVGVVTGCGLA